MLKLKIPFFLIIFLILFIPADMVYAENIKIFCIQSYSKGEGCGFRIEQGMTDYLKTTEYNNKIKYYHHYLKSKENNNLKKLIHQEVKKTLLEIEKTDPDIIVIFDDTAFENFIPHLLNTKYPVVFGGLNLPPEKYNEKFKFMNSRKNPGFNITGVTEEVSFIKALKLLKEIVPKAKNMVIISSNGMDFIGEVLEMLKTQINRNGEAYPFKLLDTVYVKDFEQFQEEVVKYENDDNIDIIFIYYL